MKLATASQMRSIDRRAIQGMGIPSLELMENAGRGIADFIKDIFNSETRGKKVAIFCGKGNNGGDGYVIARYLQTWGAVAQVILLAERDSISGDAAINLKKIEQLGIKMTSFANSEGLPLIPGTDLIVDAIFGTGFRGEMEKRTRRVIEFINDSGFPVLAVDTPSGLDNDTGEVGGVCIKADYTASLALPKLGQYIFPGRSYCGQTKIIDIGIPDDAVQAEEIGINLITASEVKQLIPDRSPTAHKGDCGKLFILAGSVGMTGAAAMAAESALKAGSGLVTVGVPESLNDILEVKLTEAMTKPIPELKKRRCLALRSLGVILDNIKVSDAVCLGPGVGRNHETMELFRRVISKIEKPSILDADGLFAFTGHAEILRDCKADLVLTPHIGEFSRLCGLSIADIAKNRITAATEFSKKLNKVVLLKGAPTFIAAPDGAIYLSPTGNSGMATGGSGDVLTGIIGALLGIGLKGIDAAICGAYIHGYAGDLAQKSIGAFGMTAGDIADFVPRVLKILKD